VSALEAAQTEAKAADEALGRFKYIDMSDLPSMASLVKTAKERAAKGPYGAVPPAYEKVVRMRKSHNYNPWPFIHVLQTPLVYDVPKGGSKKDTGQATHVCMICVLKRPDSWRSSASGCGALLMNRGSNISNARNHLESKHMSELEFLKKKFYKKLQLKRKRQQLKIESFSTTTLPLSKSAECLSVHAASLPKALVERQQQNFCRWLVVSGIAHEAVTVSSG